MAQCLLEGEVLPNGNLMICNTEIVIDGTTDLILGIIASSMTIALHVQSLPTFWRMWRTKTIGHLLPYTYMFAYWNCIVWFIYGAVSCVSSPGAPDQMTFQSFCLFTFNTIGMMFEGSYLTVFVNVQTKTDEPKARPITLTLASPFLLFLLLFLPSPWLVALKDIILLLLNVIAIMMYVSPVFTIIHVNQTKLVEYMPFGFLVTLCLNGLAWTMYSCVPQTFDLYIAISHGVGTVCAVYLLGVAYRLCSKIHKIESVHDHGSKDGLDDIEKRLLLA